VKVAVLMGGRSAEREISLKTGRGMAQALRNLRHDVTSVDAADGSELPAGDEERGARPAKRVAALPQATMLGIATSPAVREAEVVVIALHGQLGEDGKVQALLELLDKPYTGSGVMASAVAMNKAVSKRLFEHAGVPTPPWALAEVGGLIAGMLRGGATPSAVQKLGLPLVVKPNEEGSTVGLTVVRDAGQVPDAFHLAARSGHEVLFEEYIGGRELTVALLGEQPLPIVEIRPKSGFYDYEAKYTPGRTEYFCPAELPQETAERVRQLAVVAGRALDCRGVARVDFRLDEDDRPWCLEVNTIPGMTPTSLVPMAAKAQGMSYDQIVSRMLELALADHRRREREPVRN
jgi:D-alanine-D-alanine ligase